MFCSGLNTGFFHLHKKAYQLILSGAKSDEVRALNTRNLKLAFCIDANGRPDLSRPKRFICVMLAYPAGKPGNRNRLVTKFFRVTGAAVLPQWTSVYVGGIWEWKTPVIRITFVNDIAQKKSAKQAYMQRYRQLNVERKTLLCSQKVAGARVSEVAVKGEGGWIT